MREYLMPANSKRSRLILGFFTIRDLWVVAIGLLITVILLFLLQHDSLLMMVIAILPIGTATLLVFPVPHYHNVMQLLINIYNFFTKRRKYEWKGWSVVDEK